MKIDTNPRIVLCYPVEQKHIDRIAKAAPEAEIVDAGQERVATELMEADIFCGHAKVPVDWPAVVEHGRLQWIQSSAAGMDHCLTPPVIASDITVTSASGVLADQVTEHAIALLTAWTRDLPTFFGQQKTQEFVRRPTTDLTRKTVGIVGLGGVGRRLSEVLAAFECRIVATDLYPSDRPEWVEDLMPADRLPEMAAEVDFLILCAPLNESTYGMIDADILGRMKPSAVLANMARGPLVDTNALLAALDAGRLAGAVMDVTEPEPLPVGHPLWDQQSAWRIDRMTDLFCRNIRRHFAGEPLINHVQVKSTGFPARDGSVPLWIDEGRKPAE